MFWLYSVLLDDKNLVSDLQETFFIIRDVLIYERYCIYFEQYEYK